MTRSNSLIKIQSFDVPFTLVRDNTEVEWVNTAIEQTLFSFTVPGTLMGTDRWLNVKADCDYLNNSAGTKNFILKVKFGGTTVYQSTTQNWAVAAGRRAMYFELNMNNQGANNSQEGSGLFGFSSATAPTTGTGDLATSAAIALSFRFANSAISTTSDQTFAVTIQHSAADINTSIKKKNVLAVIF